MDQRTIQILFALLRSAICGTKLTEEERNNYSPDLLQDLLKITSKHDVVHLLVFGLKQNELITKENCLVHNKNTQNCRGASSKLQREFPQ